MERKFGEKGEGNEMQARGKREKGMKCRQEEKGRREKGKPLEHEILIYIVRSSLLPPASSLRSVCFRPIRAKPC
jgi:hypothetical protein